MIQSQVFLKAYQTSGQKNTCIQRDFEPLGGFWN